MSTITDVCSEADSTITHSLDRKDSYAFLMEQDTPPLTVEGDIKILKTIPLDSNGMCCKFTPNGQMFAVGIANGDIKMYQTDSGKCVYHFADEDTINVRLPVTSISFVPGSNSSRGDIMIATYASGMVKFWHVSSAESVHTINERRQTLTASISHDGSRLVTAGASERMNIYDVESGRQINYCEPSPSKYVMDGHKQRVFVAKHHPTIYSEFITGGWDNTIQYWDHRQERSTRHIFGPHICGDGLDIDAKYNHILSASWRKQDTLQVWNYDEGKLIKSIPSEFDHDSKLYCCMWLGKYHILSGGSEGNVLRIIEKHTLQTSGIISGLPGGVYSVDFDKTKVGRQHHSSTTADVTVITATVGQNLYMISNAPSAEKK